MEMTKAALREICKEHKLYRTPSLNDKLYCNFKGFRAIGCLEEYKGLKALFLEGNAFESMEGLGALEELRCLFLQQNLISKVSCLEGLHNLDTLNISCNRIQKLENLSCCQNLKTLIVAHNLLSDRTSVEHLAECTSLQTLDLQHNRLEDPAILEILVSIPDLRCLYLLGNPVVNKIRFYRKTVVSSIPSLTYLDDRPVFEKERLCSEAWSRGGLEMERKERDRIREEAAQRDRRNFEYMKKIREEGFRKKRERLGLAPGNTDPMLDQLSDSEYNFDEEPRELIDARKRLAAYSARPGEEEPTDLACVRNQIFDEGAKIIEGEWGASDSQVYFESIQENRKMLEAPEPMEVKTTIQAVELSNETETRPVIEVEEGLFSGSRHGVTSVIRDSNALQF